MVNLQRQSVKCLLSDCDGVIVDSEVIGDQILVEQLQRAFGRQDLAPLAQGLFGLQLMDIIRTLEERAGQSLSAAQRVALRERIDAEVAERASPVAGTMAAYKRIGLPLAVVSNSAYARLHRSVERAGLLPLAGRHLYSAEELGHPKPAPGAYQHAARQLDVDARHCLVIEDSVPGVRAARAAGMRVLGFIGGSHITPGHAARLAEAGATQVFADMHDLPAMLGLAAPRASCDGGGSACFSGHGPRA